MLGSPADHGVIPRAMEQVFATAGALAAQGWRYEMRAAMVEVSWLPGVASRRRSCCLPTRLRVPLPGSAAHCDLHLHRCLLQVYNEEYRDLLGKGPPPGKKHQVGAGDGLLYCPAPCV